MSRISNQIIIVIFSVLIITMFVSMWFSKISLTSIGEKVSTTYDLSIKKQAEIFIAGLVQEKITLYDERFNRYLSQVQLQAKLLSNYYNHASYYSSININQKETFTQRYANGYFLNAIDQSVAFLYWDGKTLTDEIKQEINITSHLNSFLWETQYNDPLVTATWLITKSGLGRYAPNIDPAQYFPVNFDLRNPEHDPSYSIASPLLNPQKKIKYGHLYMDAVDNGVMISAIAPVYNAKGEFKATTGIDISLRDMRNEILHFQDLSKDRNTEGFAFIIDHEGRAIAFPPSKLGLLGLSQPKDLLNLKLNNSKVAAFNQLIKHMLENSREKGVVEEIVLANIDYYVAHHYMESTGWSIGFLYSKQVLLNASKKTSQSIQQVLENDRVRVSIVTLTSLIIIGLILTWFLNKRLLHPIQNLNELTKNISDGNFNKKIVVTGNNEISQLAEHFLVMQNTVHDHIVKLSSSKRRLHDIINNTSTVIYLKDLKGKYLLINKRHEELFAISNKEIKGKTDVEIFPAEVAAKLQENDKLALLNEKAIEIEEAIYHGDRLHTYISIKFPLRNENNEIYAICGISTDITERRKAKKELEHHRNNLEQLVLERTKELSESQKRAEVANQSKSLFLANMSHEIRTPLNGVTGLIQLLLHEDLNLKQKQIVDKLNTSSLLLQQLINDILDLSKIESGKLNLENISFSLREIINQCIMTFDNQMKDKGLQLVSIINPSVPDKFLGDSHRISQILQNLVSNAFKFTASGTITIKLETSKVTQTEANIILSVTDTGIGISDQIQAEIFKNFTQADSSISRQYGGSGLGLSICKQLIELMGGNIKIQSQLGEGTRFICQIPLVMANNEIFQSKQTAINDSFQGRRILVVDDEEINLYLTKGLLETEGIHVTLADSGEKAIEIAEQEKFDVVLMDIRMPGLNGWETTRLFRASPLPQVSCVPIIGLTADVLKEHREKCLTVGMNVVVAKPFKLEELLQQIQTQIKVRY